MCASAEQCPLRPESDHSRRESEMARWATRRHMRCGKTRSIRSPRRRWRAGRLGIDPVKPKPGQIEFLDKNVDHPNGIVLADPVFQAFWKQRALPAIRRLNKSLHPTPRKSCGESYRGNQLRRCLFTQPRSRTASPLHRKRGGNTPESRHAGRPLARRLTASFGGIVSGFSSGANSLIVASMFARFARWRASLRSRL